jgi:hypothetical protein
MTLFEIVTLTPVGLCVLSIPFWAPEWEHRNRVKKMNHCGVKGCLTCGVLPPWNSDLQVYEKPQDPFMQEALLEVELFLKNEEN